jgi:hypothetical protein
MADETVKEKPVLTIAQIKEDLKNGLERFPDKENPGKANIQEKYGLRRVDVVTLFKTEGLKGLKTHTSRKTSSGKSRATIGFILQDENGNDITPVPKSATPAASTTVDASANTAEAPALQEADNSGAESNW